MPSAKPRAAPHGGAADTTKAVDEFILALVHPLKDVVELIRHTVLGADSRIAEGIKWNAPSFRTGEYFATTHLKARAGVGVVLHLGAKVRDLPPGGVAIDDPQRLLQWLAKDRAMILFADRADLLARQSAFAAVVRSWIEHVEPQPESGDARFVRR